VPAAQPKQLLEVEDPTIMEYVPVGQLAQLDAPVIAEYVPATQLRQTPEEAALTEVENVPATQLVHALTETAPSVADQVPSLHDTLKIQLISFNNINSNTTHPP